MRWFRRQASSFVGAGFEDDAYTAAGARMVDRQTALGADLVLKVQPPDESEVQALGAGKALISFLKPLDAPELAQQLAQRKINAFSMELMPRITRAQSMDALSSQSTISGYRAVLLAAAALPRIFPMLVTAAGTLKPARVLVVLHAVDGSDAGMVQ